MWYYKDQEFTEPVGYGFVYLITRVDDGKKYVGCKVFQNTTRLPPLKGQVRKRTIIKESNWQSYYGSNAELMTSVARLGPAAFHREILHLCRNKTELLYMEAKEQFQRDVLLSDDYFNKWISVKVTSRGLR